MSDTKKNILFEDFNIILAEIYISIFEGNGVAEEHMKRYKECVEGIPSAYQEDLQGVVTYIFQILEKYLKTDHSKLDYCIGVLKQYNDHVIQINQDFYIDLLKYKVLHHTEPADKKVILIEKCVKKMDDTCEIQERVYCVKELVNYAIYHPSIYELSKIKKFSTQLSDLVNKRDLYFQGKRKLI